MKYASLNILAYKRSDLLVRCIESIKKTTKYPHEIIVNLDADDNVHNQLYLFRLIQEKQISKVIYNTGRNRGVGRSFANGVGVSEGDYIFKIDTDLIFKEGWLTTAVNILETNDDVGSVSLFDYRNYDPNDTRFSILEKRSSCNIVNDFVSSIYGFSREFLELKGWDQDDGFHTKLEKLAITKTDFVSNKGFGVTKSTYVSGTEDHPFKTKTHDKPLIFP